MSYHCSVNIVINKLTYKRVLQSLQHGRLGIIAFFIDLPFDGTVLTG